MKNLVKRHTLAKNDPVKLLILETNDLVKLETNDLVKVHILETNDLIKRHILANVQSKITKSKDEVKLVTGGKIQPSAADSTRSLWGAWHAGSVWRPGIQYPLSG